MNSYDKFLIEEICPAIIDSLKTEDARYREEIKNSKYKKFYQDDSPNLSSYIFTERTLQYFIFRDLCRNFKLFPEDLVYNDPKKRVDFSIYKDVSKPKTLSEIAVEIKKLIFKKDGYFHSKCINAIIHDFDKLKQAGNKNKYILLLGISEKSILDQKILESQFHETIDKRKLKKYDLKLLHQTSFETEGNTGTTYYRVIIWKLV